MNRLDAEPPPELRTSLQRCAFLGLWIIGADFLAHRNLKSPHASENAALSFAWRQLCGMPDFLLGPVLFVLASLVALTRLLTWSQIACSTAAARSRTLRRLRRVPPYRDLMDAVESLVLLGWKEDSATPMLRRRNGTLAPVRDSCEFAIIGAGPGGSISAMLLAEAGRDTMILEEGMNVAPESCEPFTLAEMQLKYRNRGMTTTFGSPRINYAEGSCVGGGSEINSGLYHRTPAHILQHWKNSYGLVVAEQDLLPYCEANERDLNISYMPTPPPPAAAKMVQGANALGWTCQEVPRWFDYRPDGQGVRRTMTRSMLPRALAAGARVASACRALRLSRERGLWRIECSTNEGLGRIIRAQQVVLGAGAIRTAQLLRTSRLSRRAGRTLSMHPTIKVAALFPDEVNCEGVGVPTHQVKEFAPKYSFGCSISSPAFLSLAMQDHPEYLRLPDTEWRRMAVYYAMITPEGRGGVGPVPGFDAPLVTFRLKDEDLRTLATALRGLCRLLLAAGAEMLFPAIRGCGPLTTAEDLDLIPAILPRKSTRLMTVHLFSSCPIGENRDVCVADSFGAVFGAPALHVADASMLPSAPGVNPQGSIMALARHNISRLVT